MIQIEPVDLLLMVSSKSVGAGEVPKGTNCGPYPKRVLARTGLPEGHPWCAAEVSDTGAICFGADWPLPVSASVMVICEAAKNLGIRYIPADTEKGRPRKGDLYALWDAKRKRWAHIGIVVEHRGGLKILGRDGNTSGAGERDGWLHWEKERTLTSKDRLIRWVQVFPLR